MACNDRRRYNDNNNVNTESHRIVFICTHVGINPRGSKRDGESKIRDRVSATQCLDADARTYACVKRVRAAVHADLQRLSLLLGLGQLVLGTVQFGIQSSQLRSKIFLFFAFVLELELDFGVGFLLCLVSDCETMTASI